MCGGDICFSGMLCSVIGLPTLGDDSILVPTVRVQISNNNNNVCGKVYVRSILRKTGLR